MNKRELKKMVTSYDNDGLAIFTDVQLDEMKVQPRTTIAAQNEGWLIYVGKDNVYVGIKTYETEYNNNNTIIDQDGFESAIKELTVKYVGIYGSNGMGINEIIEHVSVCCESEQYVNLNDEYEIFGNYLEAFLNNDDNDTNKKMPIDRTDTDTDTSTMKQIGKDMYCMQAVGSDKGRKITLTFVVKALSFSHAIDKAETIMYRWDNDIDIKSIHATTTNNETEFYKDHIMLLSNKRIKGNMLYTQCTGEPYNYKQHHMAVERYF